MIDVSGRNKKGEIGEEDVCILLQRYKPEQVLALLREVAQSPDVKIDWDAVVKKPEIEIASARECQMLWRHLAYLQPLTDDIEEGSQPMDDDSDLEYELEPSPPVSIEFAMEVANCVKVLASGSSSELSMPNSSVVKGDMPNGHSSKTSSETRHPASLRSLLHVPVSVQKQTQVAAPSGEALDADGLESGKCPSRKKRKHWSYEEDLELIAAVKKFGEGNWANIVKGEFKGDRSASQLSQRWAIIRKKQGRLMLGGLSSQLSEAQLATRRAIDMALKDNLTGGCGAVGNGAAATSNHTNLNAANGDTPTAVSTTSSQLQNAHVTNTSVKPGSMGVAKPHPALKKAPMNAIGSVSDSIQAAAVAAGARIASPSDAATLLKAAQSKNAVHIRGGNPLIKSSATGSSPLPPNVHFIRTGLVATAATSMAAGTSTHPPRGGHQAKGSCVKPAVSQVAKATAVPPMALDQRNSAPTSTSAGEPQQMDNKTSASEPQQMDKNTSASEPRQMESKSSLEAKVSVSDSKLSAVHEDNNASSSRCLPEARGAHSDPGNQTVDADNSQCAMSKDTTETECKYPVDNEKPPTVQGSCDASVNGTDGVSPALDVPVGSTEKMVSDEADKSDQMDL